MISLNEKELVRGDYYTKEISYDIFVGYDWASTMNARDEEWLEAHNRRRKTWHERQGETYVPLLWSKQLAQDARSWARELLNDCDIDGVSHESSIAEGENLAKNKATGAGGMGQLYPPENVSFFLP